MKRPSRAVRAPETQYTAPCPIPGCDVAVLIDCDHPHWPEGPFLCLEHESAPDRFARERAAAAGLDLPQLWAA